VTSLHQAAQSFGRIVVQNDDANIGPPVNRLEELLEILLRSFCWIENELVAVNRWGTHRFPPSYSCGICPFDSQCRPEESPV